MNCYCCTEEEVAYCDHCDNPFCEEHGDPGGDRDTDSGPRAYPSVCEACRLDFEHKLRTGQYS